MVRLLAVLLTVWLATPASAITWEFAEEDGTQGWYARDGLCAIGAGTCAPLRGVTAEGAWRVTPLYNEGHPPLLELVSPPLGQPAALFDRLEVRFRVVHPDPLIGQFGLFWVAAPDEGDEGDQWSAQFYGRPVVLTGAWQTITVTDLPNQAATRPQAWSGVLQELRLRFVLSNAPAQSSANVAEAVEIDRIRLTGIEEQLQGELPPPDEGAQFFGTYLAPPTFFALRRGAGESGLMQPGSGVLADLDGDGLPDLLTGRSQGSGGGWMYALNNGAGAFGGVRLETMGLEGLSGTDRVAAADLNGDGRQDVVVMDTPTTAQVLYNAGDGAWEEGDALPDHYYIGAGDLEGDGDEDLWFVEREPAPISLVVLVAGEGPDLHRESLLMHPQGGGDMLSAWPLYLIGNLSGSAAASALIRPPFDLWPVDPGSTTEHALFTGYRMVSWRRGGFEEEPVGIAANPSQIESIGDLDGDGDLDFVLGNDRRVGFEGLWVQGLTLAAGQTDGSFRSLPWLDGAIVRAGPQELKWADLDSDGVLDVVFPDHASSGPVLVVCVGQTDGGVPVVEGRYELGGSPEEPLLGDVDGDGDADVVVIESTHGSQGGVEVFLNLAGDRPTAVADCGQHALPDAVRLGACYPNPFNAGTVIPLSVPAGGGVTRLTLYNALGQPVRTLVDGALAAGTHAVTWDGRDDAGREVAAGTYLCRLETAETSQARKVSKVE